MIREAFHSFDYESLNYQDRKDIHDALAETTLKHISSSDGLFTAVPFDVAANPSQRIEYTHLSHGNLPGHYFKVIAVKLHICGLPV